MNTSGEIHQLKRKKKRSLIQQVKKRFKKSESFSRGTKLEQEDYNYFMRVFELERNFTGTMEEKITFANNALKQSEDHEIDFSCNQLVSRIIEHLLPFASNDVLHRYFEAFSKDLRPVCVHQFASHVLRALMVAASKRSLSKGEDDSDHAEQSKEWLLKVCGFLYNNLEEFMWNMYASPVLRTAIFCLAGMPDQEKQDKKFINEIDKSLPKPPVAAMTEVPEEYLCLMESFFERVSTWPQFKDFVCNALSSRYLQCLIQALKPTRPKTYKKLSKKILKECFPKSTDENESIMYSNTALPVLESIIKNGSDKIRRKIYITHFANRLLKMSTAEIGSFTIQNFINDCNDPKIIIHMLSILGPNFQDLLVGRISMRIVVALGEACQRLGVEQSTYLKDLMDALNCGDKEDEWLVASILALKPLPLYSPMKYTQSGSRLLQALLRFKKPIKFVNSLLSYEPGQLAELFCSPYSSFITTAFYESSSIGEKSRQKLTKRLLGHFPVLAKSKFGSRSFDCIWYSGDPETKLMIVKDLANHYSDIINTQYGQFVAQNVHLLVYKKYGVEKWKQAFQQPDFKKIQKKFEFIVTEQ